MPNFSSLATIVKFLDFFYMEVISLKAQNLLAIEIHILRMSATGLSPKIRKYRSAGKKDLGRPRID